MRAKAQAMGNKGAIRYQTTRIGSKGGHFTLDWVPIDVTKGGGFHPVQKHELHIDAKWGGQECRCM